MADAQSRTLAPLLILRILEEYSDENHPLTREDIEHILDEKYSITMERKAFFRHIEHLNELENVDIRRVTVKSKTPDSKACAGFYLTGRLFSEMELRLIIDSLSGSRYLSNWETKDLVERLAGLSGKHFKQKFNHYLYTMNDRGKTENRTLLYNIENIEKAMDEKKMITFDMIATTPDGEKRITAAKQHATPIQLLVKDQTYYLLTIDASEHIKAGYLIAGYPLDWLANVEVSDMPATDIRKFPEFKHGIDLNKLLREHPSLDNFYGKPELCTFHCKCWMLDQIKGYFGPEVRVSPVEHRQTKTSSDGNTQMRTEKMLEVSVITDPYAAMRFARDNPEGIWLIAPQFANKNLRHRLETQLNYYSYLDAFIGTGNVAKD